ncbi:MAG: elongation factor Ts [Verrucomicrobiales bacterium]|jgi:elongation factor Ts
MPEITVELIKTLRDKTNAGMMNCKAALKEADGDLEAAETVLRKRGVAAADKKASRATSEGAVAARINDDAKTGVLIEVNCETDFVAKNDKFRAFVEDILDHVVSSEKTDDLEALLAQPFSGVAETLGEYVKQQVGALGENMLLSRFARFDLTGDGVIGQYIHMQGKVGVLIEVGTANADIVGKEEFRDLVKDITLHIAAASPICLTRDEVPQATIDKEKEIYADQVKGKPENIIEKILDGKIDKFFSTVCLVEQGFIKDSDQSIGDLLKAKGDALGGEITIARFARFAIGEAI